MPRSYSDGWLTDVSYSVRLMRHERSVCPAVKIPEIVRVKLKLIHSPASGSLKALFLGEVTIASTICAYYLVQREEGTGNERNTRATNIHGGLCNDKDSFSMVIVQK